MQITLAHLMIEQIERRSWAPPAREVLRLRETEAVVRPIYQSGDSAGRERALQFLRAHHYMHQAEEAKDPAMTVAFGLFLRGQIAGVVVMNPPAAGVRTKMFGSSAAGRGLIGITRTCCDDRAPYNSESYLVSAALRLLPQLDHRFHTVIAQSDLSVVDPYGRTHIGVIYQGSNAWWAGHSRTKQFRGFRDPVSGARLSRKTWNRSRSREECPPGWMIEEAPVLSNYLWFVGRQAPAARAELTPTVQVLLREGEFPVWRRPVEIRRGAKRAFSAEDRLERRQNGGDDCLCR